ncbi:MAG: DUF1501 domain-containing protein [Gemmataceae bacterium]
MLTIHDRPTRLCDGITRRELLGVGGLGLLGLGLPQLLQARDTAPLGIPPTDKTFGRAKNVIYLFLQGGPPQHETFDPKPEAPAEIRGPFKPIQTNVPGIQFCELLPRTAARADQLAVCRSLSTNDNNHDGSGYWVLTGYKYVGPNSRTIQPTDWPYFGSLVKRLKPSEKLPPLSTVWIPDIMRLNESVTPAGQTAGFMGAQWDPDRFVGNPADAGYQVRGLKLTELSPLQLERRTKLLQQVEQHFAAQERGEAVQLYDRFQQRAFDLMTSNAARTAFDVRAEPAKVRERYGKNRWGQCLLLARRLIEAGVRLVHVGWPREPGDNAVDNPMWDTHARNADRMEDVLAPIFDVGFTALIDDLNERGLLDETLVVAVGEFGRTPKINGKGGRDHWGSVFSCVLAGAGIAGGQIHGASDKNGGHPTRDRVQGGDLTASIFHLLGINWQGTFTDREGREHKLTQGEPIYKMLGIEPATSERVASTGDVARVPIYNEDERLVAASFERPVSIQPVSAAARPRGWRAEPLLQATSVAFGIRVADKGMLLGLCGGALKINKGQIAILAQEVRSPVAGTFTLRMFARGEASSRDFFEQTFLKNFSTRLVLFEYTNADKKAWPHKALITQPVLPALGSEPQSFEVSKNFINPNPGQNFSFGLGMGVAVVLEKTSDGVLEVPAQSFAWLNIDRFELDFDPKPINDKVKV